MGNTYAPRSPDLSAYHSTPAPPAFTQPPYVPPSQPLSADHQALWQAQQNVPAYYHQANQISYQSNPYPLSPPTTTTTTTTTRTRPSSAMDQGGDDDEYMPDQLEQPKPGRGRRSKKVKVEPDYGTKPAPGVEEGIEVKTKFPVARIKRIMQADEDVGKVAQVTPTAVSKALELFMISLVTKSAAQAKSKSSKKVTAAHLKQVIEQDEQFDFLQEITAKIQDAPAKKEKEEDSEGAAGSEGKRKRAPRRRKGDDESSS